MAEPALDDATTRHAARFFWVWLIVATAVSVAGNVAHAVLSAPSGTVRLAAAAAVVPPAVLLGSTHSVALLVRTRRVGVNYWCALAMTVVLAGCAFVLSFDALRDLAVALGMPPGRAWLWPVAIDVSIANSTLSLLSLSSRRPAPGTGRQEDTSGRAATSDPPAADVNPSAEMDPPGDVRGASADARRPEPVVRAARRARDGSASAGPRRALRTVPAPSRHLESAAAQQKWRPAADELVRSGVTSKDPEVVAAVLAEHAAGTPTGVISRRHNVHHSTVGRIVSASASRTS